MTTQTFQSKFNAKLDDLLQSEGKKKDTHRLLLSVQSLDPNHKSAVNYTACAGADATHISVNDPYFIASITKTMTATIILQLVAEGKIVYRGKDVPSIMGTDDNDNEIQTLWRGIHAPISDYLPTKYTNKLHVYKGKDYSAALRIHHLLHHTSGLGDYFLAKPKPSGKSATSPSSLIDQICKEGKDPLLTIEDMLEMSRTIGPTFAPTGQQSNYSDTNYQLLGAIVEHVTQQSLEDCFQERIFKPLGMSSHSRIYHVPNQAESKQPEPMLFYNKGNELKIPNIMSSFRSDGGVVSTLQDMTKFLRAYANGSLIFKVDAQQKMRRWLANENVQQWNTVFFPIQYGKSGGLMKFELPRWLTLWDCFGLMKPKKAFGPLVGHSGANGAFMFLAPEHDLLMVGSFNQMEQDSRPFSFMMQIVSTFVNCQ